MLENSQQKENEIATARERGRSEGRRSGRRRFPRENRTGSEGERRTDGIEGEQRAQLSLWIISNYEDKLIGLCSIGKIKRKVARARESYCADRFCKRVITGSVSVCKLEL